MLALATSDCACVSLCVFVCECVSWGPLTNYSLAIPKCPRSATTTTTRARATRLASTKATTKSQVEIFVVSKCVCNVSQVHTNLINTEKY